MNDVESQSRNTATPYTLVYKLNDVSIKKKKVINEIIYNIGEKEKRF